MEQVEAIRQLVAAVGEVEQMLEFFRLLLDLGQPPQLDGGSPKVQRAGEGRGRGRVDHLRIIVGSP